MTTPKSSVLNYFHTEFQSSIELDAGLENQFLLKAIGDFELDLYPIKYDSEANEFDYDLSIIEQSLLGKLMYKHYLSRERDRILKLNNIVGKDISLTSVGQSKSTIIKASENLKIEIDEILHKLKTSSFN